MKVHFSIDLESQSRTSTTVQLRDESSMYSPINRIDDRVDDRGGRDDSLTWKT
jgi:hypothetical protein